MNRLEPFKCIHFSIQRLVADSAIRGDIGGGNVRSMDQKRGVAQRLPNQVKWTYDGVTVDWPTTGRKITRCKRRRDSLKGE
jgi:hypothetical protein